MNLNSQIESAITETTGEKARFHESRPAMGGSINDSRIVSLKDGRCFFIKTNATSYPGMFAGEFEALSLLSEAGAIRVPCPLVYGENFIVLEAYQEGVKTDNWQERLGQQLANLHQKTQAIRFGFERDNYIGSTQQPNSWSDSWIDFWRDQRLGWQLHLFEAKTSTDDALLKLGDQLLAKLDELLADIDEPPVLLHGDLWSGNASADENGEPILYDPASYYGHREAEIGMMRLFGGFGPRCEAAYEEVWPLQHGSDKRIALYRLYHELNHLNLFGKSYYEACLSTMQSLL